MCGICGQTRAGDGEVLRVMNAAMAHRGPDDEGIYVDPEAGAGLGARRLSIIDLERGHQPLANEDSTVWAVLNGEIYNHPELQEHLRRRGHRLATRSDTEVLVHLYEDHGADLVHALEGMFAFAIWDARRRQLVLGRDRFGEKPLFYHEHGGELVFASELSALLRGAGRSWTLDPAALDAYFVFGYVSAPGTVVREVLQLEPGSVLTWDAGSRVAVTRCYWSPPTMPLQQRTPLAELVDEAHERFEDSVRSRLLSDVPLGVFLSGGVDSTLVAALAADNVSGALKTFSIGYDVGSLDELDAARRSAALIDADHQELVLTEADVAAHVPGYLRAVDQPIADQAFVALRALAGFARSDVTVAVGGEGADELFGGYPRYVWLARAERIPSWLLRAQTARLLALVEPRSDRLDRATEVMSPKSAAERHVAWIDGGRVEARAKVYGPRLRDWLARDPVRTVDLSVHADGSVEARFMLLDQLHWLPGDVLVKADRGTMQASLEFRTPFLSREVAEFAASIPASVHVKDGGKLLVRRVLQEVLPQADHSRRKIAFRVPAGEWLRGPLREELARVREGPLCAEGWLDAGGVDSLVAEHLDGADRSGILWPILALSLWLDGVREIVPA